MITEKEERLEWLIEIIPSLLRKIKEPDFSLKPSTGKWSKKETLGHLIDSATNNHQRFIRTQFESIPTITYDQVNWNKYSNYQDMDPKHLIEFWTIYNQHLLEVIKRIPVENLQKKCNTGTDVTLLWLIEDYVVHMEHHLHQIVNY